MQRSIERALFEVPPAVREPQPSKLAWGHHAAMPYEDIAVFIAKLRTRKASSALALELCILTAARSGEILGMRWPKIYLDKKIWTVPDKHGVEASAPRRGILRPGQPRRMAATGQDSALLAGLPAMPDW
jgi:integrase